MQFFKTNADYQFKKYRLIGKMLEFSNESKGFYFQSFHSAQYRMKALIQLILPISTNLVKAVDSDKDENKIDKRGSKSWEDEMYVEGCRGKLCLHLDCLLYVVK